MVWSAEDLGPIGVVTWLGFAVPYAYHRLQRIAQEVEACDPGHGRWLN